jgi:hypothetical protein
MIRVEMRLAFVPFLFATCVDDRAAQTFGEAGFPIGAIVAVSEVSNHESRRPQSYTQLVIYNSGSEIFMCCAWEG